MRDCAINLLDKDVGKLNIIGLVWYALGEWDKPNFKYKEYYTNKLIDLLEKNKCYDALKLTNTAKDKLMRIDLPKILDFCLCRLQNMINNYRHET